MHQHTHYASVRLAHHIKRSILTLCRHLLGKKSWNVYSAANRERVAQDEALAEAAARDDELRQKNRDSETTIELLRNGKNLPGSLKLSDQEKLLIKATTNLRASVKDTRKRKRKPGEDDTDADLRHAKEKTENHEAASDKAIVRLRPTDSKDADAPLMDRRGNINLFPESKPTVEKQLSRSEKNKEQERQKNAEQNQGTHLTDVLGRNGSKPAWYLDKDGTVKDSVGRDVWGNEDPRQQERQAQRITTSDPLAFMKQAQKQLKQVHRDRKEREQELEQLKSRRTREETEFEDFSLDAPSQRNDRRRERPDHKHHRQRSRSRSKERSSKHSRRRRERSRSPSNRHHNHRRRSRS